MTKLLTAVFIAIVATSYGWRITFDASPDNDRVQMDTLCYANGRLVWKAVDVFPIEPGSSSMSVRRHPTPTQATCQISVFLFKKDAEFPSENSGITE